MVRVLALLRLGAFLGLAALLAAGPAVPRPVASLRGILAAEHARIVTPGLKRALASPDEAIAVRAALAIGRTKRRDGEPLLVSRLHDSRAAVRAMSVYGIGLIASGKQTHAIHAALFDASGAVRVAALDAADRYAVAHVVTGDSAEGLAAAVVTRLASDRDPIVRARAAATLASFAGAPNAGAALRALVRAVTRDRDPLVRRFAMWSIFRDYAKAAPEAFLVRSLGDRDEVVRIEAVRAIGMRRSAGDAPVVLPLLNDRSWRVQEQASETLRLIDGKKPTDHWKALPPWLHVPARVADPLQSLPAFPRTRFQGPSKAPTVASVLRDARLWSVTLDPRSASAMSGPARGLHPRVRIVTTQGNVYVALFPEWAPFTVENFLSLANRGYYDNNRWFRIVPDFVVQTGDPHDNGNGDAGYSIDNEENPIVQNSYVISMGLNYTNGKDAHAIRDSAGAQYYITLSPQLHLDRDFTVFGEVTSGFDVLGRLTESDRVLRVEEVAGEML